MVTIDLIIEDEVRTLWKNAWTEWQAGQKNSLVKDIFPQYDSFDDFMDDFTSKTRAVIEEVIAKNELNGDFSAEYLISDYNKISSFAANFCLARYSLSESSDSKAVFSINNGVLFRQIFGIFSSPDETYDVIQHEFRHHIDRHFLPYAHENRAGYKSIYRIKKNEKGEHDIASVNLMNYFLKYLFDTRTEGFASFDRTFVEFDKTLTEEDFAASPERVFRQSLARHTDTLTQVLNYCGNQKTMTYNKFSKHLELLDMFPGRKCVGSDLKTEEAFSPYVQGPLLFKIIALAEMKKRAKQNQKIVRLGDLLRKNEIPKNIHKSVSKKVLKLQTLGEFFNLFYDSARELRLRQSELIVPKAYIERYAAGK